MVILKKVTPVYGVKGISLPQKNQQWSRIHKTREIMECLEQRNVDLWHLRELALSRGGFINANLRQRAWQKLLGINKHTLSRRTQLSPGDSSHYDCDVSDLDLIRRDVGRSVLFRYISTIRSAYSPDDSTAVKSEGPAKNKEAKDEKLDCANHLTAAILGALSQVHAKYDVQTKDDDRLHYFQGFHDVASVILVNLSNNVSLSSSILETIGRSHFRDAMKKDFSTLSRGLDTAFFPLLWMLDREVHDFLLLAEVESTVILPWIITWFSHDITDLSIISRLFDAFLTSHALLPFYLAVSVIVHPNHRRTILSTECDLAMVHMGIKGLLTNPSHDIHWEGLLEDAILIMEKYPPRNIPDLGKRYDGCESVCPHVFSVDLFKSPPAWAFASSAPCDLFKARMRQNHCIDNERMVYLLQESRTSSHIPDEKHAVRQLIQSRQYDQAKIALGIAAVPTKSSFAGLYYAISWPSKLIQLFIRTCCQISFGDKNDALHL